MKKILLLIVVMIFVHSVDAQKQIAFTGWNEFSFDFQSNTGNIKVGKVSNFRNGGRSGTLYLQVWLFNSPYANTSIPGYMLAEINIGTLNGGWSLSDISYPISWSTAVPAGTFYVTFLLVEYDPKPAGSYWAVDYLNFPQRVTKNAVETPEEALRKLATILSRANQQQYPEDYHTSTIVNQSFGQGKVRVEKRESDKSGKIIQEWIYIPWYTLYAIDGYASSSTSSDILMLSLKFDGNAAYTYTLEGKPDAQTNRRDARQINIYIRRSDHGEAVRLINLVADSY